MTSDTRHAILPKNPECPKISDLAVGKAAYIVHWGMWVDSERRCWLHPDHDARAFPAAACKMRIERRKDGYHVWAPPDVAWEPRPKPCYYSPAATAYIPVVELHDA
jgi:hypothetical protein